MFVQVFPPSLLISHWTVGVGAPLAVAASVAGRITTNSSPPYRAMMSVSRVLPRRIRAVACKIRSPA